ncbi:TonB-dependent receptor [Flagellimonas marinaquae]|uniref:TonB-dependent receptor n=1 Tax=Flagellimonas marinaquae TaxID=254955 RepID=A0AA48KNP4_9FLAO|nr:TonB-dependent receptor [Allomuricauda aquimarina]
MKNLTIAILWVLFAICCTYGQTYKVTGKVVDEQNQIVPYANILLLRAIDSTFVQGTSANDEGFFELVEVAPDLYLLQASYVGRGSEPRALDITTDVSLGALIIPLSDNELDEVVVTAQRPKLQRLPDRLVFSVENTVVSQGTSWDILKNTPGVIVNQDQLLIRGQNATVYLNDRKVQLSGQEVQDLLQGLSGTNIKSVEVIANPPASYDAEGGPILNIVTSKNIVPGYKGNVNGTFTQAVFPKFSMGTSHYYKTDKLNLFANYTINPQKEINKTNKGINFIDSSDAVFSVWDTDYDQTNRSQSQNASFILDYTFDAQNSLNVTSNLLFNLDQEQETVLNTDMGNAQAQLDSTFATRNSSNLDNTNLAFDLTYVHKLKKEGAQIRANGHYTYFNGEMFQRLSTNYFDANSSFLRDFGFDTDSDQQIKIFTGQLDYSAPIGSASFETGAKLSSITSESTMDFYNFNGSSNTVDASQSDRYIYDEDVYAAYLSFVKNWEKWSMKLGVRGELTKAEGNSITLGQTNTQDFFEPFPSVYVLYSPSDKHSFSFDYGRNIERPKYNDLNPFRFFYNENDYEEGNPSLKPAFSNNFNLNYTLNSEYFFDLYYRDNGNHISYLVFQDNDNQTLVELKQNVLESKSYGLDFTLSKSIMPAWFVYAYTSFFHEEETFLAEESGNVPFTNEISGVYSYLGNYLTLSNDGTFTGEVAATYVSKFLFGSYVSDEQFNLTIGLRKTLFDNKVTVSLAAEDILEQYVPTYRSKYLNQDNFYRRRPETQFIRFGFTYNFGNFRLEDNERGIDKKERDRLQSPN